MKTFTYILLLLIMVSCKPPEARQPESVKSGSYITESVERNKKLIKKEHALIKAIISKDSSSTYLTSNSGFWYKHEIKIQNDSISTAGFGDIVNFNYNLKDLNGTTIYTAEELGTQNYIMDKQELFTGLREGLKLMKPGETVTFLFPSQKAFGYYGDKNRIGTNVPIRSQVTVNSITNADRPDNDRP